MESNALKRSHDDFSGDEVTVEDRGLDAGVKQQATEPARQFHTSKGGNTITSPAGAGYIACRMDFTNTCIAMTPDVDIARVSSSPLSSPGSPLSDIGTCTPPRGSPSPRATPTKAASDKLATAASKPPASASKTSAQPPAKRKRRTAAEKEAEEREKAQKKKEREELKEAKQISKAIEKAKVDAEKQAKQAEKAKAEAEKQAKIDEKRRKKEEEERKAREEKEKKERAQPKLISFFSKTPATPKKETPATSTKTESPVKAPIADSTKSPAAKEEKSEYEKRFKPFFVHETVRMAKSPFEMDEETQVAKSTILEEFFQGKRTKEIRKGDFDPVEALQLPSRPAPRGRIYPPVKYTVEKMRKLTQKAEGASEEDKKAIMKETTDALRNIPIKTLRFWQDVRPPYKGTVTLRPYQAGKDGMRRLARKPTLRDLMPINYDHDSEAEWESEGEDVDIDDDDEEDLDGDDDMDEFLDDSEDTGPARYVSANGLEPVSTGLCWEDRKRMGPVRTVYEHRMEFILGKPNPTTRSRSRINTSFKESLDRHSGIDPFSTKYWEPEPKPKAAKATKDKASKEKASKEKVVAESSTPANAFQALGAKNNAQSLPKKLLENNHLQELKKVIQANPKIAKGGLIDLSYVALAHAKISRSEIKEAIATIAERSGGQGRAGTWVLKPLYLD
ncbi:chromatin assembly factor 1 subunit A [Colletotrichum truncatum]|uniref:Chromatin assembly factor 1 subunit A n=1 Tax=Colletotrichum truncatum TaxID=5467 RepID=A0ACC3ZGW5_COLTU